MNWTIEDRPQKLSEVYGLNNIKRLFTKYAQQDNWPKAMLFRGKYGTGKTTAAKIAAKMMVCQNPETNGDPCNECPSCKAINEEKWNRDVIQINGGQSGKTDVIASIKEAISAPPIRDKRNVVIIEEVQELSTAAQNSLLKDLEGKMKNTHFILLSMQFGGLSGFVSRCTPFNFNQLSVKELMLYLKGVLEKHGLWEGDELPKEFKLRGLATIAQTSDGSIRQALQLLDTCLTGEFFTPQEIQDNLGIADEATVLEIMLMLMDGNTSALDELSKYKPGEFYALAYKIITDAVIYKNTGWVEDESNTFFVANTKKAASHPKCELLHSALMDINEVSKGYLRKADLLSALLKVLSAPEPSARIRQTRPVRPTV